MKRSSLLGTLLLITFVITGCQLPTFISGSEPIQRPVPVEGDKATPETTIPAVTETTTEVTPMADTAPFFKNGDIEFNTDIKSIEPNTIVTKKLQEEIVASYNKNWVKENGPAQEWTTDATGASGISSYFNFYDAGTFKTAPYENQKLVVLSLQCDGPCGPDLYRFAYDKTQNKLTFLGEYSSNNRPLMVIPLTKNPANTVIKGLALAEKIKYPNSDKYATVQLRDYMYTKDYEFTFGAVIFVDPEFGNVYGQNSNQVNQQSGEYPSCLLVKSPDGSVSMYGYDPKFMSIDGSPVAKVWVNWKDGNVKSDLGKEYAYIAGGCGMTGACYMIENVKEEDLILVGTTSNGVDLYVAKNPVDSATATQNQAQEALIAAYETYNNMIQYDTTKKAMDFKTFVSKRPLLYWKDPLNRWAGLVNQDVRQPAECGKPVIYLYPEKETDVSVKVKIDEFTKTVPAYGDGWKVHAYPNGKIYNYADKQVYPYLFWEGKKKGGITASSGSVVKKEELGKFLDNSLDSLGLNKAEKDEFVSFWLPKMQANKEEYCFVSFIGTRDFNKVAPLEITPAPQTLLRVFMYYQPVNNFFNTVPQVLKGMERKGFTVVEWGGTSSAPWQNQ